MVVVIPKNRYLMTWCLPKKSFEFIFFFPFGSGCFKKAPQKFFENGFCEARSARCGVVSDSRAFFSGGASPSPTAPKTNRALWVWAEIFAPTDMRAHIKVRFCQRFLFASRREPLGANIVRCGFVSDSRAFFSGGESPSPTAYKYWVFCRAVACCRRLI